MRPESGHREILSMNRLKLQTRWKRSPEASARLRKKKALTKQLAENKLKERQAIEKTRRYEEEARRHQEETRRLEEVIKELELQIEKKRAQLAQECAETVGSGFGTDTPLKYFTSEASSGNENTLPSLKSLEASLPTVEQHISLPMFTHNASVPITMPDVFHDGGRVIDWRIIH
ncbi:hypothetical protein E4U37_001570 [Claviceps purpurea]|nr:hypothetical protein E4U37_001570 [Claviceps purpurea]